MSNDKRDDTGTEIAHGITNAILGVGLGVIMGLYSRSKENRRKLVTPNALEFQGTGWHHDPLSQVKYTESENSVRALGVIMVPTGMCGALWLCSLDDYSHARMLIFGGLLGVWLLFWIWFANKYGGAHKRIVPKLPVSDEIDFGKVKAYTIRMPRSTQADFKTATRFIDQMLTKARFRLTFQIVAEPGQISWRILDLRNQFAFEVMQQAIHSFYPDAEVTTSVIEDAQFTNNFYRMTLPVTQIGEFYFPIVDKESGASIDPLINLTREFVKLEDGEHLEYTLIVSDQASYLYDQLDTIFATPSQFVAPNIWADVAYAVSSPSVQKPLSTEVKRVIQSKVDCPDICQALLLIQIDAKSEARLQQISSCATQLTQFRNYPYSVLVPTDFVPVQYIQDKETAKKSSTLGLFNSWLTAKSDLWLEFCLLLHSGELAALWHLPNKTFTANTIQWVQGRSVEIPTSIKGKEDGVLLGHNLHAGQGEMVYLPYTNRITPVMVLGKSRFGKSNLLHHAIHQDIAAGKSVVVVDPHGKLIEDILQCSIPPERENDVVIFDLDNRDYPPPLNPLRGLNDSTTVTRVVDILHKLYPDLTDMSQTVDALENALLTLKGQSAATLWDVDRLFSDDRYRSQMVDKLTDPILRRFWKNEYDRNKGNQLQISAPITRRLRRFYRNEALRLIICHPDSVDFGDLVRQNKIVLVSLRTQENAIPEEEQRLVGALIVARIQMAAMNGAFKNNPCYCYVDELQHFVATSIDRVFSEAGKFNLSLMMANQFLGQLEGDTLKSAMGNLSTLIVFQVSHDDARSLSPYLKPSFDSDDLVALDRFHAAIWMRDENRTAAAFSLVTSSPLPRPTDAQAREAKLRRLSQATYTPKSRQEVLDWLTERERESEVTEGSDDEQFYDQPGT